MKIELELLEEKHASTSYKWRNNKNVWEYTFNKPEKEITLDNELSWLKKVKEDKNRCSFAILCDGVYIGNIYLTNIKNGVSFFGIFIGDTSYWGKGIGAKATALILEYGFSDLGLKKIKLRVKVDNDAACSVYSKLGFKKNKVEEDAVHMSLSPKDFKELVGFGIKSNPVK